MILDHCLDNSKHKCVLIYVFRAIDLRLSELSCIRNHELEKVIELWDIIRDRVFDKVLVDWDALDDVNDSLDVEFARERVGRDRRVLTRWERQVNLLDREVLLDQLDQDA